MSAISSLSSVLGISSTSTPVTAGLAELDPKTFLEAPGTQKAFQYWPETISDNKNAEWSKKSVPGGSHPILQFINGGERTISFSAVFTQEINPEKGGLLGLSFGLGDLLGNQQKNNVDIAAAVEWLRSFTYPSYDESTGAALAPPLAILYLPGSGIISASGFEDSVVVVMTECNVVYEAFHRNGTPRLVAVSLAFSECIQDSTAWRFQGRNSFPGLADYDSALDYFPKYERDVVGQDGEDAF
jgi:hypothetical protein